MQVRSACHARDNGADMRSVLSRCLAVLQASILEQIRATSAALGASTLSDYTIPIQPSITPIQPFTIPIQPSITPIQPSTIPTTLYNPYTTLYNPYTTLYNPYTTLYNPIPSLYYPI
jgi:hypothetical protein